MLSVFVSHNGSSPFGFTSDHPKEDDDDEKKKTIIDSTTSKSASCTAAANEATTRTIAKRTEAILTPRDPNNPPRRFKDVFFEVRVILFLVVSQKADLPSSSLLPDKREIWREKVRTIKKYGTIFCPSLSIFDTLNNNTLNNTLNIEWKRREEKSSREKQTLFRLCACANALCASNENERFVVSFFFSVVVLAKNTKHDFSSSKSVVVLRSSSSSSRLYEHYWRLCREDERSGLIIIIIIVRRLWKTTTLRRKKKKDGAVSDSKVSDDERAREQSRHQRREERRL